MLLAFAGVTGVGKSYFKDLIVDKLGFEKIKIITTREVRKNEIGKIDKVFVAKDELDEMCKAGEIAYKFDLLGNTYAYTKRELFSDKNTVFEMHYECIYDFKKICPDVKVIYLLPYDLQVPKDKLKERELMPEVEEARVKEIDEHYNKYFSDENLRKQFDYVIYNNYNKKTDEEVINLVKRLMQEK